MSAGMSVVDAVLTVVVQDTIAIAAATARKRVFFIILVGF
jgi:hypothetical protein